MEYDCLIEAAELVENTSDMVKLIRLKDLERNCKFYVTVWGHYSSGKSKLINNILDRDILPVQTRETTAVLTYIQYGVHEECVIIFENGTSSNCDLPVLKSIFQNTYEEYDISNIDHIEVYVNNELLKNGLVLVDTPGVNTIIQKHQDLAVDAIEQSGRIIYVLGNPPTNVDRQFINEISECGIQISFVRTKCDKFINTEENPECSLKNEQNELQTFISTPVEYFAVSNEKKSKWFENIKEVRNLLQNMSRDINEEMRNANNNRKYVYFQKYMNILQDEVQCMSDVIEGNIEKYNIEIENYQKEIKRVEEISDNIEKNVTQKVKNIKKVAQRELDTLISERIEEFMREVETVENNADKSIIINEIYNRHVKATIKKIQRILNFYFDDIIKDETQEIFTDLSSEINTETIPTYSEVQQENSRVVEMYNARLIEVKEKIEAILAEKDENNHLEKELEAEFDEKAYIEALAELDKQLTEIPSGAALRLADNQQIQPSSVFKTIGNAADIALLLIPGDVIFKGIKAVTNTTKIAQTLHKMGKVGKVITKAGSAIGKNAKAIDTVRDTAYALNTAMGKRRYSTKEEKAAAERIVDKTAQTVGSAYETFKEEKREGNVLDALSVAYWTEKFGKQFDSAPKMEIDVEEQNSRNELRKKITEQQQQLSNERIQRKKELGLLQDKEKELLALEQEEQIKQKRIEEELCKQERLEKDQIRKRAFERYCKDYKVYYENTIKQISESISDEYFQNANQNVTMYVSMQTSSLKKEIETKKRRIEELVALKENGDVETEKQLECYKNLLGKMETEIKCV